MRDILRRLLSWGVVSTLLLPVVLAVVLGLGALLGALGDGAGAAACGRLGLVVGAAWIVALAATSAACGIALLDGGGAAESERAGPSEPER